MNKQLSVNSVINYMINSFVNDKTNSTVNKIAINYQKLTMSQSQTDNDINNN